MQLNAFGDIARSHWQQLSQHHSNIIIDESILMPNHLHGIIILELLTDFTKSISEIIRGFKTFSAKAINQERGLRGVPVWQRSYYDYLRYAPRTHYQKRIRTRSCQAIYYQQSPQLGRR
jgi:putative transposase